MKHAYYIKFKSTDRIRYAMPYLFTNKSDAYLYGEYAYRTDPEIDSYRVIELWKPSYLDWFKL